MFEENPIDITPYEKEESMETRAYDEEVFVEVSEDFLKGEKGDKGDAYILTEQDKQEIAEITEDILQPQFAEIHEEIALLDRDINNKVISLDEGLENQGKVIDSIIETLEEVDDEITNLDTEVERLTENINNIVNDVNKIDTKADKIATDVSVNKTEIRELEENQNYLEEHKADKEEIPDISNLQEKLIAGDNITIKNNIISATGGGSGSNNYNDLENKPKINDIELVGNLTSHDIGLIDEENVVTIMENQKYNYIKDGLVNNTNELTDEEKLKIETWLGISENYLTTYNNIPYQVENDYNPAHKKYVDSENKKLDVKIKELELFKFPNMTIIGTPTIQNGQVSNFTMNDYLEFPFLVDFRNRPFEINFAFTTGNNVTTQQNILDSVFGLALAIKNGKILMAISYNGVSWFNQYTGTLIIEPNTTYVYKITWNGILYKVQYYNGSQYVDDFSFTSTQQPYPKQMFIGVSKLSDNYFEGSINLNYANLKVDSNIVWSGMDDARTCE